MAYHRIDKYKLEDLIRSTKDKLAKSFLVYLQEIFTDSGKFNGGVEQILFDWSAKKIKDRLHGFIYGSVSYPAQEVDYMFAAREILPKLADIYIGTYEKNNSSNKFKKNLKKWKKIKRNYGN